MTEPTPSPADAGDMDDAPQGTELTPAEHDDIMRQVEMITMANQGRDPGEHVSVDPMDVN